MKWLFVPLLWAMAALLAVAVLWRLYRGKNIILRGKWSPRVIRMVAIILVVLVGVEKAPTAPVTPPADKTKTDAKSDDLPAAVTTTSVKHWLEVQLSVRADNRWLQFKQDMTHAVQQGASADEIKALHPALDPASPAKLLNLFRHDLEALAAGKELPRLDARDILDLYDAMEAAGVYDHWLNAYLWRRTATTDTAQLAEVYARMYRHSRITDTLIRAHGEVKPYMVSARVWMSKGGPGPAARAQEEKGVEEMVAAAKKLYPAIDGGTWKRDAIVVLSVAKDSPAPTLLRAGRKQALPSGETVRFGRLDLFETPPGDKPVSLEHAWLGPITLPANRTLSAWQLPSLLSDESQKKLAKVVQDALDGDEEAADKLELALPLTHSAIRAGLAEAPKAKLAPRLRMMLALFDDAVMPALALPKVTEAPLGPGGGPGGPPGGER